MPTLGYTTKILEVSSSDTQTLRTQKLGTSEPHEIGNSKTRELRNFKGLEQPHWVESLVSSLVEAWSKCSWNLNPNPFGSFIQVLSEAWFDSLRKFGPSRLGNLIVLHVQKLGPSPFKSLLQNSFGCLIRVPSDVSSKFV